MRRLPPAAAGAAAPTTAACLPLFHPSPAAAAVAAAAAAAAIPSPIPAPAALSFAAALAAVSNKGLPAAGGVAGLPGRRAPPPADLAASPPLRQGHAPASAALRADSEMLRACVILRALDARGA